MFWLAGVELACNPSGLADLCVVGIREACLGLQGSFSREQGWRSGGSQGLCPGGEWWVGHRRMVGGQDNIIAHVARDIIAIS
jgi:hypothetical protein